MIGNPPIFDGHNDTILDLYRPKEGEARSFFERSDRGHIDLPRAREGGLCGGFFALFVRNPTNSKERAPFPGEDVRDTTASYRMALPAVLERAYALEFTMGMMAQLLRLEDEADGAVKIVHTVNDLERCLPAGTLAMIMHMEGADAIDEDLDALHVFHAAGLRSLGIVWSRSNAFAHGVPFAFPSSPDTGPGLSDAGTRLVRACNQLRILVDLSHLNEQGFWDVVELSDGPLVATHSGAHALSPSSRNLTDEQLDAIRASGGVVGVNFHTGFLRADGRADLDTSLEEIANHVDYMVEHMGIDHVALGSDFDGATMPQDLKDVAGLPRLVSALRQRGYDGGDLEKIAYANWVRVLRETWKA